jgi:hypothetical protein
LTLGIEKVPVNAEEENKDQNKNSHQLEWEKIL